MNHIVRIVTLFLVAKCCFGDVLTKWFKAESRIYHGTIIPWSATGHPNLYQCLASCMKNATCEAVLYKKEVNQCSELTDIKFGPASNDIKTYLKGEI